jgi:UDP-glucose 4-epimerase
VGRQLVSNLLDRGCTVYAVDVTEGRADIPVHVRDLRIAGALDEWLSSDTVVFHLAAMTSVSGSVHSPRPDFEVNVGGTFEVLESVRRLGGRIVFSSSSAVFDPSSPLPHSETAPKRASSPYGASKLCGEVYCHVFHLNYDVDVRIARLFNVYGDGMTRYAIYDFYEKIRKADQEFTILGDGEQVRDFVYVEDATRAMLTIAEAGQPGEDYNVGSGEPVKMIDLAGLMARIMGRGDLKIRTSGKSFSGDVAKWYADITKLRSIGFEPTVSMEAGLKRTIDSLHKRRDSEER